MPLYATEDQIRAIHRGIDEGEDLLIFQQSANAVVTDVLVPLARYTDERLGLIEAWLSAHFYAVSAKETSMETVSSVSEQYQYKLGMHLANSMYGQQAMGLDTSGKLAALNKKYDSAITGTVGIHYLGSERTPA